MSIYLQSSFATKYLFIILLLTDDIKSLPASLNLKYFRKKCLRIALYETVIGFQLNFSQNDFLSIIF
jgi:hypothetical protein